MMLVDEMKYVKILEVRENKLSLEQELFVDDYFGDDTYSPINFLVVNGIGYSNTYSKVLLPKGEEYVENDGKKELAFTSNIEYGMGLYFKYDSPFFPQFNGNRIIYMGDDDKELVVAPGVNSTNIQILEQNSQQLNFYNPFKSDLLLSLKYHENKLLISEFKQTGTREGDMMQIILHPSIDGMYTFGPPILSADGKYLLTLHTNTPDYIYNATEPEVIFQLFQIEAKDEDDDSTLRIDKECVKDKYVSITK